MTDKNTPAFPNASIKTKDGVDVWGEGGMTLRQYAAIKLRVPDSGTDWLDEMIRKSQRDEFAAKAMQTLLGSEYTSEHGLHEGWMTSLAHESYMVAKAMTKRGEA